MRIKKYERSIRTRKEGQRRRIELGGVIIVEYVDT